MRQEKPCNVGDLEMGCLKDSYFALWGKLWSFYYFGVNSAGALHERWHGHWPLAAMSAPVCGGVWGYLGLLRLMNIETKICGEGPFSHNCLSGCERGLVVAVSLPLWFCSLHSTSLLSHHCHCPRTHVAFWRLKRLCSNP